MNSIPRHRLHLLYAIALYGMLALGFLAPWSSNRYWLWEPRNTETVSHLRQIEQAKLSLEEGQFPARVSPYEHNGWRYPVFQFDSPLTYTLGGWIEKNITPGNPLIPGKFILWLAFLIGGTGAYLLCRFFTRSWLAALLGGCLYMAAPYFFLYALTSTHIPNSLSMGIAPLSAYFTIRCFSNANRKWIVYCALAWTALVMTHTVTFMYNLLFTLGMVALFTRLCKRRFFGWLRLAAAMALCFCLGAYFLVPIIHVSGMLAIDLPKYTYNPFSWNGLTPLSVLLSPIHVAPISDGITQAWSVRLGWPVLAGAAMVFFTVAAAIRRRARGWKIAGAILLMFAVAVFALWSPVDFWQFLPHVLWKIGFSQRLSIQVMWLGAVLGSLGMVALFGPRLRMPHVILGLMVIVFSGSSNMVIDRSRATVQDITALTAKPDIVNDHRENFLLQRHLYSTNAIFANVDCAAFTDYFGWLILDEERAFPLPALKRPTAIRLVGFLPQDVFTNAVTLTAYVNGRPVTNARFNPGEVTDMRIPLSAIQWNDKTVRLMFHASATFRLKENEIGDNSGRAHVAVHLRYFTFEGLDPSQTAIPVQYIQRACYQRGPVTHCDVTVPAEAAVLQLPVLFYPGLLDVRVDGVASPCFPTFQRPWFLMTSVRLPPGPHRITCEFVGVRWANWISGVTLFILCIGGLAAAARRFFSFFKSGMSPGKKKDPHGLKTKGVATPRRYAGRDEPREEPETIPRRPAWFGLLFTGILLFLSAFLIGLLELFASFQTQLPSTDTVKNYRLNHTWPPSSAAEHREWIEKNPDFPEPYIHYHNKQAWVERYDVAEQKKPGTYRIFYVGDSFTEGCVPMEESIASRLETHLNEKYRGKGITFEVINTGTSSYSPTLEYILIRYFITPYSPDLIVVNVDMTDDFDDWNYRDTLVRDGEGNPFAAPPRDVSNRETIVTKEGAQKNTWLLRLKLFLYRNSYVYNFIQNHRSAPPAKRTTTPDTRENTYWDWCQHEWTPLTEEKARYTMDMLGRIADYCKSNGIKLLLTGVPHYEQYPSAGESRAKWSARPHIEIEKVAREKGVAYLDSYKALQSAVSGSRQDQYYYKDDMHFNPRGNALWAQKHIEAICDPNNRLLPATVY